MKGVSSIKHNLPQISHTTISSLCVSSLSASPRIRDRDLHLLVMFASTCLSKLTKVPTKFPPLVNRLALTLLYATPHFRTPLQISHATISSPSVLSLSASPHICDRHLRPLVMFASTRLSNPTKFPTKFPPFVNRLALTLLYATPHFRTPPVLPKLPFLHFNSFNCPCPTPKILLRCSNGTISGRKCGRM